MRIALDHTRHYEKSYKTHRQSPKEIEPIEETLDTHHTLPTSNVIANQSKAFSKYIATAKSENAIAKVYTSKRKSRLSVLSHHLTIDRIE